MLYQLLQLLGADDSVREHIPLSEPQVATQRGC